MKEYKTANGETRLWYAPSEIDTIMVSELVSAKLMPSSDDEDLAIDVEPFAQAHLMVRLDQYAKLDTHVLGITEFRRGERPKISVNRDLTGSALDDEDATPGMIGRWRATVAHEAAHVLLHGHLFEVDSMQRGLFGGESLPARNQLFRCLKRDVGYRREHSDWREVQANMGMAALLMPKPLFVDATLQALASVGINDNSIEAGSAEHRHLVDQLAARFSVSKQAVSIRLTIFGAVHSQDAPALE